VDSSGDLLDPSLAHLLHGWMPAQRWYPAKGRGVSLHQVGSYRLDDPDGEVGLEVHLVGLDSGDRLDVVQVPLTYRTAPDDGLAHALVGTGTHPRLGERWVYDGLHDPVFVREWLRLVAEQRDVPGAGGTLSDAPGAPRIDPDAPAKVLSGEQSNTSVVVGGDRPDALIVKMFRVLSDGPNPDVEVTSALSRAGVRAVPRVAGWVTGEWTVAGRLCRGHLAVAVEFLAGSQDAWREALSAAAAGRPFTAEATELGAATAAVHAALRDAFGTEPATDEVRAGLVAALQQRVDWAVSSSDALVTVREQLARHRERLGDLAAGGVPDLQRVHGDYHLGQVLHAPGRGWVLLDFEGEPLRPLSERTEPDVALRDVVGMLRSFDYAAGHVALHTTEPAVAEQAHHWAQECRTAFLEGYRAEAGVDLDDLGLLVDALWLDKALYEVVYETRNRPDWVDVPLSAVRAALA
jgi:1,4-alpha-glucan branching enzyme